MITHRDFHQLRLRSFVDDVVELQDWQFMGREWIGEANGFTEWLRPVDDPSRLGSLALDLAQLDEVVAGEILDQLGLALRLGMTLTEVVGVLGDQIDTQQFVPDRRSYDFHVDSPDGYSVSCTIKDDDGLIYVVVMADAG